MLVREFAEDPAGVIVAFEGPGEAAANAARAFAEELDLGLYRVDLSKIISKYIGETEKNLDEIAQREEARGAVWSIEKAEDLPLIAPERFESRLREAGSVAVVVTRNAEGVATHLGHRLRAVFTVS